jgi:glucoamylase
MLSILCLVYFTLYVRAASLPPWREAVQTRLSNLVHLEQTTLGPQSTLESWIDQEEKVALEKLLANIAPGGKNVKQAAAGTVVASPSQTDPDYWYQCKRPPKL